MYTYSYDGIKNSCYKITEVISGKAAGPDYYGEKWGEHPFREYPIQFFSAKWNQYGNAAGPIRNGEMAKYTDQTVAIWDGHSTGTFDMICKTLLEYKKVFIWYPHLGYGI